MSNRKRPLSRREFWFALAIILLLVAYQIATQDAQPGSSTDVADTPPTRTAVSAPQTPSTPGQPDTPAASANLQFYTTTQTLVYPDVAKKRPDVPLLTAFLADVDAAKSSIDIAVFDIDLQQLGNALLAAKRRGVAVRVVFDDENLSDARVAKLIGSLEDAGITVRSDQREPFMHEKMAVFDGTVVWTGSWNMTINDTYRNNNNMVRIVSPAMARGFTAEADQLVAGFFGVHKQPSAPRRTIAIGDRTLEWSFSPQDGINARDVALIDAAQTQITFMAFSYTDPAIAQAMVRAKKRGVTVRGVMEKQNSDGTGSVFDTIKRGKVDILVDGNCYIMHHKTIVIDDATVITGSYNFTKSAEKANDESQIIITDPAAVQTYLAEYDRVRAQAESPTACEK